MTEPVRWIDALEKGSAVSDGYAMPSGTLQKCRLRAGKEFRRSVVSSFHHSQGRVHIPEKTRVLTVQPLPRTPLHVAQRFVLYVSIQRDESVGQPAGHFLAGWVGCSTF